MTAAPCRHVSSFPSPPTCQSLSSRGRRHAQRLSSPPSAASSPSSTPSTSPVNAVTAARHGRGRRRRPNGSANASVAALSAATCTWERRTGHQTRGAPVTASLASRPQLHAPLHGRVERLVQGDGAPAEGGAAAGHPAHRRRVRGRRQRGEEADARHGDAQDGRGEADDEGEAGGARAPDGVQPHGVAGVGVLEGAGVEDGQLEQHRIRIGQQDDGGGAAAVGRAELGALQRDGEEEGADDDHHVQPLCARGVDRRGGCQCCASRVQRLMQMGET
mmetsp:Transcript_10904/g.28039  ORF Transcript_10904/g.28039 Transcript_10904/m.28039 type:complete len:275 (-) Transcript_10904:56-880(-)